MGKTWSVTCRFCGSLCADAYVRDHWLLGLDLELIENCTENSISDVNDVHSGLVLIKLSRVCLSSVWM